MKYFILHIFLLTTLTLGAQTSKSFDWNIDLSSYDAVHVYNKYGDINIDTHKDQTAKVNGQLTIQSSTLKKLLQRDEVIQLDTAVVDNELIIHLQLPDCFLARNDEDGLYSYRNDHQGGIWNNRNYKYQLDLTVSLPSYIDLYVSNHNGGLKVNGVIGKLLAHNHHDDIVLMGVGDVRYVHTHHGDIDVLFAGMPSHDIELDTHHGDISLYFSGTPGFNVKYDTHHGSIYSEFDWEPMATSFKKEKHKKGTKYKVGKVQQVTIGGGGLDLDLHSHHGSFYLLKDDQFENN